MPSSSIPDSIRIRQARVGKPATGSPQRIVFTTMTIRYRMERAKIKKPTTEDRIRGLLEKAMIPSKA